MKINVLKYVKTPIFCNISHWRDLNPRPADYESAAQPAKLQWQLDCAVKGNENKNTRQSITRINACIVITRLFQKDSASERMLAAVSTGFVIMGQCPDSITL